MNNILISTELARDFAFECFDAIICGIREDEEAEKNSESSCKIA